MKAIKRGAKVYVVDPRRTVSAQWADGWLGLEVGTDIALAHTVAREIVRSGLVNDNFVSRATRGLEEYLEVIEPWTLEQGEAVTGVPGELIAEMARAYASADRAVLCWTLGITEHHNGTDNVSSLINLALLTGHVGRYGSGLSPLRGQNNVQGGGDMGAIPNKLPGFQEVTDDAIRARFDAAWGSPVPPERGWHLSAMFDAMERKELTGVYCIGENPVQSEADTTRAVGLLRGLEHLVVQDIFMTRTAELADVVLPASATWCEAEGTVTNSERRVQRVRKARELPPGARDDIAIIYDIAKAMGHDWGEPVPEVIWDELRSLSPMHAGMSYRRLEENHGLFWPCYDEDHPGEMFLHSRLWAEPLLGEPAPFAAVKHDPPVEALDDSYPIRLTTGRRLDSYNTGVQTGSFTTPLRRPETLDMSPEDLARYGLCSGDLVQATSRRGSVQVAVRSDKSLRPGLAFMTLHFQDEVMTNFLTIDATDPKAGTAEFKAAAIRVEPLVQRGGGESALVRAAVPEAAVPGGVAR